MNKIIILSTDTLHHRFFINRLLDEDIKFTKCMFETTSVTPPFPVGPLFENSQEEFDQTNFFKNTRKNLDRIEIMEVENINSDHSIQFLKSERPDFGIVFGTRKLSKKIIACFKDGAINVHRGISQDYRGLDSDLWAVYHKDFSNIGVTIHFVEERLDTGDIVAQDKLLLKRDMKIHQIRYYTTLIATELVLKALDSYLNESLKPTPQKKGRYYSFMPLVLKRIVANKFNSYCKEKI